MAELVLFCLQPPVEGDALLLSWSLEVLTGPLPTKLAGHDLHKAAVWLHEVVVDEPCSMHANLRHRHTVRTHHSGQGKRLAVSV